MRILNLHKSVDLNNNKIKQKVVINCKDLGSLNRFKKYIKNYDNRQNIITEINMFIKAHKGCNVQITLANKHYKRHNNSFNYLPLNSIPLNDSLDSYMSLSESGILNEQDLCSNNCVSSKEDSCSNIYVSSEELQDSNVMSYRRNHNSNNTQEQLSQINETVESPLQPQSQEIINAQGLFKLFKLFIERF